MNHNPLTEGLWPICIPSKGRAGASKFIAELIDEGVQKLWIWVEPQDEAAYREAYPTATLKVLDKNDQGLCYVTEQVREFALAMEWPWFWMCDDDPVGFRKRENGKSVKTTALEAMLYTQLLAGDGVGMVGMARAATNFPGGPAVLVNKGVEWLRGLSREACKVARFRLAVYADVDFPIQVLDAGLITRRTTLRDVDLPPDGTNKGGMAETYKKAEIRMQSEAELVRYWPLVCSFKDGKLRRKWAMAFRPKTPIRNEIQRSNSESLRDDFCVFILTHGRPDKVHTYDTLMREGYTGKVYIVIDDEDKTADGYRDRFGDKVLQFSKDEWAKKTDEGDNFQHRKAIVYARNACWELARKVGCKYFVQFDDDYTSFRIRHNSKHQYVGHNHGKRIDEIFTIMLDFYISTQATSIAMSQGGDHLGGAGIDEDGLQNNVPTIRRKCMNSWFCDVDKPILFFGHMNEDVSAYVTYGHRGHLFFTAMQVMLTQNPTQVTAGGMSDLYLDSGTYQKSFYTVMANPSCVQVGTFGDHRTGNYRIHHKINWHNAVPKIIDEMYKKVI